MIRGPAMVPSANRGPTNLNSPLPAINDFLRFTTSEAVVLSDAVEDVAIRSAMREFVEGFFPDSGIALEAEIKGGRRGYTHHVQLLTPDGESCGDIAYGGDRQRGTVSVELTGAGCARVSAARPFAEAWGHVRCCLDTVNARITEFHAAHDQYAGERSLETARSMYENGAFDGQFKRPAIQQLGWNDGSGLTLYIGKKTATRQLVVYEKGREQGLRDGDEGVEWVRWEARFYARNRAIPTAVVETPWEYMVGEYPALNWISACMSVMATAIKRTQANLIAAVRHCKRQYGGLLNVITKLHLDDESIGRFVRNRLARSATPRWVTSNPYGRATLGMAFATHEIAT